MNKRQQIEAFADDYTEAVTHFYQAGRKAGRHPSNAEIVEACPLPTGFGETEAYYIIVAVTMLVDSDMKDEAKDVSNTVKAAGADWERRRARLAEIETKATDRRRRARVKELKAESEAAARAKKLDTHMAEMLEQSRARQAVAAERAKIDEQLAAQSAIRAQSFPIPRG